MNYERCRHGWLVSAKQCPQCNEASDLQKRINLAMEHIDITINIVEKYNYDAEELAEIMIIDLCELKDILIGIRHERGVIL